MSSAVLGVRVPIQARAKESFDRVLREGAELIREEGLAGFSISEVCRRAHVSAGALYARIDGKESLIRAIHDYETTRIIAETVVFDYGPRWERLTTGDLITEAVRELGAHYLRHAAMLNAFVPRSATDKQMRVQGIKMLATLDSRFTSLILTRSADIPHPDIRLAVNICYRIASDVVTWEAVFGGEIRFPEQLPSAEYIDVLADIVRLYLFTPPSGGL